MNPTFQSPKCPIPHPHTICLQDEISHLNVCFQAVCPLFFKISDCVFVTFLLVTRPAHHINLSFISLRRLHVMNFIIMRLSESCCSLLSCGLMAQQELGKTVEYF
jgi:hypothetical protein